MNNLILYISMSINAGSLVLCFYMIGSMNYLKNRLATQKKQISLLISAGESSVEMMRKFSKILYNKE